MPLRAQTAAPLAATDSIDLLRQARKAQRNFERIRRAHLPAELDPGSHPCDERIGRYCYWYDPYPGRPYQEPRVIQRSRRRLLNQLTPVAHRIPGDGWIAGQLVRYLAEQGQLDSAVAWAKRCRAERWWCSALEGLARHLAMDYEGSDSSFSRALGAMPEKERCAWTDLRRVLGQGQRLYRKLDCAARDSVADRIWWLAHPLYSRPGNDLRTEHYTRHTMALLLQRAASADLSSWGDDRREMVVRFGWPTHYSRAFRPGRLDPSIILGHEPAPSFWLFPMPALVEPWDDVTETRWKPEMELPPSRYAPAYAKAFSFFERVQFARFNRGDSTLSLAVYDLTADTLFATRPAKVRLAVARDPRTSPVVGPPSPARTRGTLTVHSEWRPAVLSLEAIALDSPLVGRRRAVAPPDPGGLPPLISDILLFHPIEALPQSLETALASALSAPVVPRGQRVGLYWEMYEEADSAEPQEFAVTAMKARKEEDIYPVGRPSCPFPSEPSVRVDWREEPGEAPRGPARSVSLDLRSLPKGRYVVSIRVSSLGRARGCSSRELQIVAGGSLTE